VLASDAMTGNSWADTAGRQELRSGVGASRRPGFGSGMVKLEDSGSFGIIVEGLR
jgi:hypothetical protein